MNQDDPDDQAGSSPRDDGLDWLRMPNWIVPVSLIFLAFSHFR